MKSPYYQGFSNLTSKIGKSANIKGFRDLTVAEMLLSVILF
ncbi:hypothetical protein LRI_2048 (plasmid) [Limosilactobacillus reuteri I5007]|uniref:Uncharacterized protein n=1 Tax=Limosilactobacillus reuteri I5007 TaxID=1340495 RepID=R9WM84_LIMRT|nr:hypothetical protein LRI_2048 [Limosilactobacillus reuteri I5007]